jgi:single-stranded DNA-binding protein
MLEGKTSVSIQGFLKQESWTDQNGKMQSRIVVVATRIFIIEDLQGPKLSAILEDNGDNIPF